MNKVYSTGKLIINENVLKADTNSLVWSYLVMDMYGETISRYSRIFRCSKVNSVCLLTNLIDQLKHIHTAGFIHNDIKPDNIVFKNEACSGSAIRLIDFGETSPYLNSNGVHFKETDRCINTGNILISSCSKLENKIPSRKDDMIGLAYMVLFLIDSLPYQAYYFDNIDQISYKKVKAHLYQMKVKAKAEDYCTKETEFLLPYLEEVFGMDYESEPDYGKLKFLLVKSLLEEGIVPLKNALCSDYEPREKTNEFRLEEDESSHACGFDISANKLPLR